MNNYPVNCKKTSVNDRANGFGVLQARFRNWREKSPNFIVNDEKSNMDELPSISVNSPPYYPSENTLISNPSCSSIDIHTNYYSSIPSSIESHCNQINDYLVSPKLPLSTIHPKSQTKIKPNIEQNNNLLLQGGE